MFIYADGKHYPAPRKTSLLDTLIHDFGALGVALGAGLEGETAVVVGGALARHGAFSPYLSALGAWAGSFVADQLFFGIGRSQRQSRFVQRAAAKPAFARALAIIERHPIAFCLAFRFVYGFRVAGPVAIGASRVPVKLFVGLNAISAGLWAAIFTTIGFRFDKAFEAVLHKLITPTHLATAALVLAVATVIILALRRRKS